MTPDQWIKVGGIAANFFGNGLNAYMQDRTNQQNASLQANANQQVWDMWSAQNQYNLPAAQVARLKAAGLNPAMMYQSAPMNEAAQGGSFGAPNLRAPQIQPVDPLVGAQIDFLKAQAENLRGHSKGMDIQNEIDGMNLEAFKKAYSDGLIPRALEASYQKILDDSSMSRYDLYQAAWNFAIITGISMQDSWHAAKTNNTDYFDSNLGYTLPFAFDKEAFDKAEKLFIGGREAQISANDAAKLVADITKQQKQKDLDIWTTINDLTNSDDKFKRTLGIIATIGLFIAEQRFGTPNFNFSIDRSTSNDYSGHDHRTAVINNSD